MNTPEEHEAGLLGFITTVRRQRYSDQLQRKAGREKFVARLAHFPHWDPACVVMIGAETRDVVVAALVKRGAGSLCWCISESRKLDRRELPLAEAISLVLGSQQGTVISCLPGRLGYYEGEDARCLLVRDKSRALQ